MAEQSVPKRGGGLQRFILWVVIAALFGTVWWLASDRNEHRFRAVARGNALVIERGRFFPTGSSPLPPTDKVYAPFAIPAGERPPADTEFDEQNALDRWLFDQLPSRSKVAELTTLRADLAWDDAQQDIASAAQLIDGARRKLEAVRQGNGAHAVDASALSGKLEGVQHTLRDLAKRP
jgi:hypothetical protein